LPLSADWHVVALVLLAALLHATWNAVSKASADPLGALALITASGGVAMAILIPFVPAPARAAWPYLGASLALHFFYQLSLVAAYRHGDLSQVYPIARGLAPMGIAVVAAAALGEAPSTLQGAGLVLACAAIASLAFGGEAASRHAVFHATSTALWISVYSVVDGQGARLSGNALGFACWSLALDSLPITLWALARRRGRLLELARLEGRRCVAGGVMSVIGYSIVLWAFARMPLWAVSALRETSVVFAAFLGSRVLGERFGRRRVAAAIVLAIGLVLVHA
jgi:drug/metabolite transporter (DMT)-like permease